MSVKESSEVRTNGGQCNIVEKDSVKSDIPFHRGFRQSLPRQREHLFADGVPEGQIDVRSHSLNAHPQQTDSKVLFRLHFTGY